MKFVGRTAQSFRDILVHGEFFEVDGVDHGQKMKRDVKRHFGIVKEVTNDDVVFAKNAVSGDEAEDFVGEVGHGSKGFHFLIREARGLQDGALYDLVGVANERAAGFRTALDGKLNALGDRHFRDLLEKGLTALRVGLGFGGRLGQGRFVYGAAVHFVKNVFLIGSDRTRMFEGCGKSQGITDTAQIFEQRLNSNSRQMPNDRHKERSRTILVVHESFADAGFVRKIFGRVGEQSGKSFGTLECIHKNFRGNGKQGILSARSDHFVGIMRKHGEHFGAVNGV